MKDKALQRTLLIGVAAFVIYGGWAWSVNQSAGTWIAFKAGFAQGTMSFLVTTFMTGSIEFMFRRLKPSFIGFSITALLPVSLLVILMALIHYIIGTPNVLMTVAPSAIVGVVYSTIYTLLLGKTKKIKHVC